MENLPQSRGPKRQIDWRLAAQLLAEGQTTTEVATVLGCSRQHVWRILRRSHALRARTTELRRRQMSEAATRLYGLRDMALDTIHQAIADGNKRMACWLTERLRLFDVPPLEETAGMGEAGADQFESETIIDMADTPLDVARATLLLDRAERDIDAAQAAEVTNEPDQGDKLVTVTSGNALSGRRSTATRSAGWPPPGVFADG